MDLIQKIKINSKKIVSWAGTLLMVASLVFLGRRLFSYQADFEISSLITSTVIIGLVLVTLFEGFGILLASFNFRALVKNVSGFLVDRPLAMVVYTVSNLYKYIPGGVMYVAGRHRLAVETEALSHSKVALSTVLEGIIIAFAAIVLIIVTVFDHAAEYLRYVELPTAVVVVLIAVVVIAGSVLFSLRKKIADKMQKLFEHMRVLSPLVLLKRFGFGLILMTLWGGTFLATLMVMGQPLTPSQVPTVIGLFLLSWLAGFLTPGAPSGLGIREVVILMFMGGILNEEILLSAMIMHRIVAAVGDVTAYGIAIGYAKLKQKAVNI
ncbi:MAG: hypothetical protein FWE11_03915 [Defluviitaleaceae bacterium]|nr:hypothetical protein [Defluviitaleaceae bacterium]